MAGGAETLKGIGDGLITVLPGPFFNSSVLERLWATGLLGGVLALEEDGETAVSRTVVGGGGPVSSPKAPVGGSDGGSGADTNPDVKTPQVF